MKAPPVLHSGPIRAAAGCHRLPKTETCLGNRQWEIHTCRTLEEIRAVQPIWEKLREKTGFRADIEADYKRYLSVVESTPDCEPFTLLVFRDGIPRAMLIGMRSLVTIHCKFGYLKVLKPRLRCVTMIHGGYLGDFCEQTCRRLFDYLYTSVYTDAVDAVMFKQLPVTSPLYALIKKQPSVFRRSHFSKIDRHWRMAIPDQMDTFYAQHSSKTRQTLKRQVRQLDKGFQVRLAECRGPESLSRALPDAAAVSSQTYQYALGWGLKDDPVTRKQLVTAAQNGRLYLHVLYLNEKPSAFQLGLQCRGTYFLQTMGFAPDLKRWHPGTVLFLKVIDRLCQDSRIHCFDFGFGDAEYKRRFATEYWDESTLYLYAPRAYPVVVNMLHAAVSGLSEGMRFLAQKTGIEGKIKRKWRNLLQE